MLDYELIYTLHTRDNSQRTINLMNKEKGPRMYTKQTFQQNATSLLILWITDSQLLKEKKQSSNIKNTDRSFGTPRACLNGKRDITRHKLPIHLLC